MDTKEPFVNEDPDTVTEETPAKPAERKPRSRSKAATASAPTTNTKSFEEGVGIVRHGSLMSLKQLQNEVKRKLDAQPKYMLTIPVIPGASKKASPFFDIQVNGVTYRIKRGVSVEVPKSIYEAYMHTASSNSKK